MRRYVAIAELVGQHYVHLRPQRQYRLIPHRAFVGGLGLPLPTLDDGRVQIHGGDLLRGATATQLLHYIPIHRRQALQWLALAGNVRHPVQRQLLLRLFDLGGIVKLAEKLPRCFRRRHSVPQ